MPTVLKYRRITSRDEVHVQSHVPIGVRSTAFSQSAGLSPLPGHVMVGVSVTSALTSSQLAQTIARVTNLGMQKHQQVTAETAATTGDIVPLSLAVCQSALLRAKVDAALRTLNDGREKRFTLVDIVSATKQVINGFKYVIHVKLAETQCPEGEVAEYKMVYFEREGNPQNLEVSLLRV